MLALPEVLSESAMDNSFLSETLQVCVVTRDHRRTMAGMVEAGIGSWQIYTFAKARLTETTYRGRPVEFSMKVCLTWTGRMNFPTGSTRPEPDEWYPSPPRQR